jgi:hypothetical protein
MKEVTMVFPSLDLMKNFIAKENVTNIECCTTRLTVSGKLSYEQIGKAHFTYDAKLKH